MNDNVFLQTPDALIPLSRSTYENESVLQEILARYPEVLAGPKTVGESDRLLLIDREIPVPDSEGGGAVFSLDHLFVDSAGVPILVEVKRSTDTRIRREVVGQMLDYAANAIAFWPDSFIEAALAARLEESGRSVAESVADDLDFTGSPEEFSATVNQNLRKGKVRLIFVADQIPRRLVNIIELLNGQMVQTEVLGVEVPQYVKEGSPYSATVPRVVGRTNEAVRKKVENTNWDSERFIALALAANDPSQVALIKALLNHVQSHGVQSWGKGQSAGVSGRYVVDGTETRIWELRMAGDGSVPHLVLFPHKPFQINPTRTTAAVELLESIPAFATAFAEAPGKDWRIQPRVDMAEVAGNLEAESALFAGIEKLVGLRGGHVTDS